METFNQLLNRFVQQSGISDAELARAVGVSRQTIFRWREGQTGHPRQREDVLAIAKKLRLTPAERDLLLLAAGFQPEQITLPDYSESDAPVPLEVKSTEEIKVTDQNHPAEPEEGVAPISPSNIRRTWRQPLVAAIVGLFLLLGGLTRWLSGVYLDGQAKTGPTATPVMTTPQPSPAPTPAAEGETVILVTHFANYASSQVGYNVAGRLAEALQREMDDLRLPASRVAIWPEAIANRPQALQAGQAVSATLVIYGEYDAGRVVVKFAQPADEASFSAPALLRHVADLPELAAVINSALPQQARSLALLALGQIFLGQNDPEQARLLLLQARHNLQDDPAADPPTLALASFYLGLAYHYSQPPSLDEAITAYGEAVTAWPELISSRVNRAAAYQARGRPGDLELALRDAEAVVTAAPEWASGYNNRASIRLSMGGADNLALALADLDQALALKPDFAEAYFNRAYVRLGQGLALEEAAPDLDRALELRPDYGPALNLLCWGYALEQQPETALPYCQAAVAANPDSAAFKDSRALAYALLGDYPAAVADFKIYAAWLDQEKPGPAWQKELSRRTAWIESLESGQNPFTSTLLAELRQELGR